MPVTGASKPSGVDEILEHDLTRAGVQAEETGCLLEVQPESRHLAVGPGNHRFDSGSGRLTGRNAVVTTPFTDRSGVRHRPNKKQNPRRWVVTVDRGNRRNR